MADRGGGRKPFGEEIAHAAGAAVAEVLVALGVAVAVVDRAEIIPDPQHVARLARGDEAVQLLVGQPGGGDGTAVFALVQLDRGEQPAAAGRPAQRTVAAAVDRRVDLPQFHGRGGVEGLQRHLQVARVGAGRGVGAEAEQRQRAGLGQGRGDLGHAVGHPRRAARLRVDLGVFTALHHCVQPGTTRALCYTPRPLPPGGGNASSVRNRAWRNRQRHSTNWPPWSWNA